MRPISTISAIAAPLPMSNVDTDKIIPAVWLKTTTRTGLREGLFEALRQIDVGERRIPFILERQPWTDAEILVTLDNFGCGSSREHAPWALLDFGIRCIVAESFGDIFFANCIKNGILPIRLPPDAVSTIMGLVSEEESCRLHVDLAEGTIADWKGQIYAFEIASDHRDALLHGTDDLDVILGHERAISAYERACGWPSEVVGERQVVK